jgi:hypothetical protein
MKHRALVLLFSMFVGASALNTPASAQTKTVGMKDKGDVWIFRDGKALSEFYRLINSKVYDMTLIAPLISCTVPSGTKVVITDGGAFSSTVLVVDGQEKGCRGDVANERFRD